MKLKTVKIGKREFELAYPLNANLEITEQIPGFDLQKIKGYIAKPSNEMLIILTALARYGAILSGKELDVDKSWFGAHIPCSLKSIINIQVAIFETIAEWSAMETEEDDTDAEVDVALEEIKKKDNKGN